MAQDRKEYMKEWYAKNREVQLAKMRERYKSAPDKVRAYREANRDKLSAASRRYRQKNLELARERDKKRYWENRDKELERSRIYRHAHIQEAEAVRVLRVYGVTKAEWDAFYAKQGGVCAICGKTSKRRLVVDHDHATGKVRGLLCYNCNLLLGHSNDTLEVLQKAQVYLSNIGGHDAEKPV